MQMFEVFAVASQRESIYGEDSRNVELGGKEGSLSLLNLRLLLSVQIIGPHTSVLIARRQV